MVNVEKRFAGNTFSVASVEFVAGAGPGLFSGYISEFFHRKKALVIETHLFIPVSILVIIRVMASRKLGHLKILV